ncbi:DNA-directed RNA polymerase subunit alpha C-terminal domain-containing protein [Blastococcus sp. TBT05-19]|uniref:DNA-directed RNA polymerase subunit alpha C-terminal domain-containing protein n=1 Tax=Blastococcus sp. TBT05-19 TaxID=2250581 RepID=UPI0011BDD077|nr:DNA-directed RNA polymerase subunit alpha C-terminal domain-containing protein [Blastococcus sp. TBT05-19]
MPRKSPGAVPAQTVRELDLPGRAVTALTRAGITAVEDLSSLTRAELAAVPGLGAGMVAAIRQVVPEPVGTITRSAAPRDPDDEDSPAAPSIPSFASLRDTSRRSPIDLLVPQQLPLPEPEPARTVAPPRPPEWADLWHLGLRVARWWLQQPARTVRRLLG